MVDLKKVPYCLSDEDCDWVERTIAAMSIEEKIGQMFITLNKTRDYDRYEKMCSKYHVGGIRWAGGTLKEVYDQNRYYQEHSKIPVLIAANCEQGGNGAVSEGTLVAPPAACGASSPDIAREVGRISAIEASAIGCNWTFAPISDLYLNWRNTIVNTRSYGENPEKVIACARAFMEEMHAAGMACCAKHFPGDGTEERDQHMVMGCNDLSCEEWDKSYGKVYRELIDAGIESIMVGHICLPEYSRKFIQGIKDEDIKPATLAPEIIGGLLRDKLGFNGVIITDASHMVGLWAAAPRSVQVPGAIAAGCDMFLFFENADEDFGYMLDGYKNGVISENRLSDALHRILGLKAKLNLHKRSFPQEEGLCTVGAQAHKLATQRAADASITLVKDTQKLIPINPKEKPRVKLIYLQDAPKSFALTSDPAKALVIEELERAGFQVTVGEDYYELERKQQTLKNIPLITNQPSVESLRSSFDWIFLVANMQGYYYENSVRIRYSFSHSVEMPWYVNVLPTVGMSLNFTNHLIDLPMVKTYINAYAPCREYIRAAIEKIIGKSEFKGSAEETVWCGRWETKI